MHRLQPHSHHRPHEYTRGRWWEWGWRWQPQTVVAALPLPSTTHSLSTWCTASSRPSYTTSQRLRVRSVVNSGVLCCSSREHGGEQGRCEVQPGCVSRDGRAVRRANGKRVLPALRLPCHINSTAPNLLVSCVLRVTHLLVSSTRSRVGAKAPASKGVRKPRLPMAKHSTGGSGSSWGEGERGRWRGRGAWRDGGRRDRVCGRLWAT